MWELPYAASATLKIKKKIKKVKGIMKKDNCFLYSHLAKYSEFPLFPELGSIENLCENGFTIFFF